MLRDFLKANRSELISRCREKVRARRAPLATPEEIEHGVPIFLDQLTEMLPGGAHAQPGKQDSASADRTLAEARLEEEALRHGEELHRHNFTIEQVVHDYGDLCQAVTQLAGEKGADITVEEFGTLNIKLDNAIASAVTEFARNNGTPVAGAGELGNIAREMRVLHAIMAVAMAAMDRGLVGYASATSRAMRESSAKLGALIERTARLAES